jgi:hypothetical protein
MHLFLLLLLQPLQRSLLLCKNRELLLLRNKSLRISHEEIPLAHMFSDFRQIKGCFQITV